MKTDPADIHPDAPSPGSGEPSSLAKTSGADVSPDAGEGPLRCVTHVPKCLYRECLQRYGNKAIRDGRPRPPCHQVKLRKMGFIAISYGGSELRHRSILETITHRPKCQIQKL